MSYNFIRNSKSVSDIKKDFTAGKLKIDPNYQRRKVWNDQDKVRLIETILMGFLIPEVFFWESEIDPDTGDIATHIVDGQQRINAIVDFIANQFELKEKYLLSEEIKRLFSDKRFDDLPPEIKTAIWGYKIPVVEIDKKCTINEIKNIFYRLNLTNYSLNQQEKLNSKDSAFGDKALALSSLTFWNDKKVFSATDAKRMKDIEYCCNIYILSIEGVVDQTSSKKINDYYDDYRETFDEDNHITERIIAAMGVLEKLADKSTMSFLSKKSQMYTLFCMAFKMMDNGIVYSDALFERFKMFVNTYDNFRNEFTSEAIDRGLHELYELIKKYKLASSEGINKISNRVIRLETLFKICFEFDDSIIAKMDILSERFKELLSALKTKPDSLEKDDLIDVSETE